LTWPNAWAAAAPGIIEPAVPDQDLELAGALTEAVRDEILAATLAPTPELG
jgi:hypothetical protein